MPNESNDVLEWVWDTSETTSTTLLKCDNQEVCFHPSFSDGTAAVRGNQPFIAGQDYFWEIEMISPLYGTDVMVGVGTEKVNLKKYQFEFGSLLGSDEESWGFSYRGTLQHNKILKQYGRGYSQGNIIGVHLDMWLGSLTFYLNRRSLGVAFTKLKVNVLYPMVCSTAARSAMRIVSAVSYTSSLQLRCLETLGKRYDLVKKLESIPGLRTHMKKAFWLFPSQEAMKTEQPPKRRIECEYGADEECPSKMQCSFCVICQGPLSMVKQSSTNGESSSKRLALCLGCELIV